MTGHCEVRGRREAERLYGRPEVQTYDLDDWGDRDRFWEMWHSRQAEVVLVLRRPDGQLVLQTKAFYPPGTFRLPTGGVKEGEGLLAAVARETREETGLPAHVACFLGILCYRFSRAGRPMERASCVFLLDVGPGELCPKDVSERITAFREVPLWELEQVAGRLEQMPGDWAVWGMFRALAHRFVAGALARHECEGSKLGPL